MVVIIDLEKNAPSLDLDDAKIVLAIRIVVRIKGDFGQSDIDGGDEISSHGLDALVNKYFRKDRVIQGGYPMEMRYAGPREALLHAVFRQNYGCSHLIVGRDHAGVGDYDGLFDAQKIFNEIPADALLLRALSMDSNFDCYECATMASMKTCPHEEGRHRREGNYKGGARLLLSGTLLRKLMSEGKTVPPEFSKPEVIAVLKEYYDTGRRRSR